MPGQSIYEELAAMGFRRVATLVGRDMLMEAALKPEPAVYLALLEGRVFWVGETGDARRRFGEYRRWLALPDDSPRADRRTRDRLLETANGRPMTFFLKEPMMILSEITGKHYPGHRVEETILIDHFRPPWNTRSGGRRR